jgi:hypothetical protein
MIYVGIVGAQSPLGQKVTQFLLPQKDLYRIVFYVDAGYRVNSPSLATYASVEAALSFNQPPTLVIDCDDPITAIDRAKTYRFYAVSAIMCCTCMPSELDDLRCSYVAENQQAPSLFITPDYRPRVVRLIDFYLNVAARDRKDVDRFEIEVDLPPLKRINLARWLYFGSLLNDKFGIADAKYSVKGNVCNYGNVIIKAVNSNLLTGNAENVQARLYYGEKRSLCYTFMKVASDDCAKEALQGVDLMLKWFVSHPEEVSSGKVFVDHLSKILQEKRKNLL